MKVITEEQIYDFEQEGYEPTLATLKNSLQEIDTLTVSKLRPMCAAKIGNQILIVVDDYGIVSGYKSSNDGDAFGNGHYFKADEVLGWLPLPVYEPEGV